MQEHEQRVVDELKELTYKRERLRAFIEVNPIFEKLPTDEQSRLRMQFVFMTQYEDILQQRIAHFPA